jgi:formyl-CoA transferase
VGEVRVIMKQETSATWVARLEKAGVPCSAINDLAAMRAHPQTEALGMVQPVPEIELGLLSLPLSLDGKRPAIRSRAPQLGEHNAELDVPWTTEKR